MRQTKHTKIRQNGVGGNWIAILIQRVHPINPIIEGGYDEQVLEVVHYKTRNGAEKKCQKWGIPAPENNKVYSN